MIRLLIISLYTIYLLYPLSLLTAQQNYVIVTGYVKDAGTGEILPNANIRVEGTSWGTTTNREGVYRLRIPLGEHNVIFSYIGYNSKTLHIVPEKEEITRNVYLESVTLDLQEVVIYPHPIDPAEEIIRKAIQHKKEILSKLHSYKFNAYTKTTLRAVRMKDEKPDTIIGGILETHTEGYWKTPDLYQENILARRQTANFSPQVNIFTVGRIPNFNDDLVVIGGRTVIGPTSPRALQYYSYRMVDTLYIDHHRVFEIEVIPKTELVPLFKGTISIVDESFIFVQVDVMGNDALDISQMENIRIRQQFACYEEDLWLPIESIIDYEMHLAFPSRVRVIYTEQYSLIYDYEINKEIPSRTFRSNYITALPMADRRKPEYWEQINVLPFTSEEAAAFERIDSIMVHVDFFARTIINFPRYISRIQDSPYTKLSDYFRFNRIEGAYTGVGLEFDGILPRTSFTMRAGHGLSDNRWKYGAGVEHHLTQRENITLGLEYNRTIMNIGDDGSFTPGWVTWLSLLNKNDPDDYYYVDGFTTHLSAQPMRDTRISVRFHDQQHSDATVNTGFSFFNTSRNYRNNPSIVEGRFRSLELAFLYDTRRFVDLGFITEIDRSFNSWLIDLSLEHSGENILYSDFEFTRYRLAVNRFQKIPVLGSFTVDLKLGYSDGYLPPQRLFSFDAAAGGLSHGGVLKTMEPREFHGDRFAKLLVEQNFGSLPFRLAGVPWLQKTDLILYTGFGYTGLSEKGASLQDYPVTKTDGIFSEVGFGLGRLLGLFRLDFTWRLTHKIDRNFRVTLSSGLM